ncbi:MAG: hypothetical protein PUA56_05290, partial [Bacillales bacterium]|nr:hypothetical protein [Bacillales bacterium]
KMLVFACYILIHNITFLSTGRSDYIISLDRLISFSYFITEFTLSLKVHEEKTVFLILIYLQNN